jgi:hypothetical protein
MMISALAVAACVAGCATAWVRPDAESVDLSRENVECQFEASKLTASAGLEGVAAEQRRAELENLCMEAKAGRGGEHDPQAQELATAHEKLAVAIQKHLDERLPPLAPQ